MKKYQILFLFVVFSVNFAYRSQKIIKDLKAKHQLNVGETVSFECIGKNASWEYPYKLINIGLYSDWSTIEVQYKENESILKLQNISLNNIGEYSCRHSQSYIKNIEMFIEDGDENIYEGNEITGLDLIKVDENDDDYSIAIFILLRNIKYKFNFKSNSDDFEYKDIYDDDDDDGNDDVNDDEYDDDYDDEDDDDNDNGYHNNSSYNNSNIKYDENNDDEYGYHNNSFYNNSNTEYDENSYNNSFSSDRNDFKSDNSITENYGNEYVEKNGTDDDNDVCSINKELTYIKILISCKSDNSLETRKFRISKHYLRSSRSKSEAEKSFKHLCTIDKNDKSKFFKNLTKEYLCTPKNDYAYTDYILTNEKPSVYIISKKFNQINEPSKIKCIVQHYKKPEMDLLFKPCLNNSCSFTSFKGKMVIKKFIPRELITEYSFVLNQSISGVFQCKANIHGNTVTKEVDYYVTDVSDGFDIWGQSIKKEENKYISSVNEDDSFDITCGISIYINNSNDINWYQIKKNDEFILIQNQTLNSRYMIIRNDTNLSNTIIMRIYNVTKNETGKYFCGYGNNTADGLIVQVIVQYDTLPQFTETYTNGTELKFNSRSTYQLKCEVNGISNPNITWKKNNMDMDENKRIKFIKNNTVIKFLIMEQEDEGEYVCEVVNKVGKIHKKIRLLFQNKINNLAMNLSISIVIFTIFIISVVVLIVKIRNKQKIKKELREMGLAFFENGEPDKLNSDLSVFDQTECLPYDKKWEIPLKNLRLGKQLGSGAFGIVLKAEAYGIRKNQIVTVAVKMVKRNCDPSKMQALVSELKIMANLGKNLNVVNLIGACTRKIAKRELLVVIEYCSHGNLHNYLLRNRKKFINQIDSETDTINDMIDVVSSEIEINDDSIECFDEKKEEICGSYEDNETIKPICTNDLLSWAFQVSRGMDYLSARKVLHGDLAARNILLADDNVVKICDFGLAKPMFNNRYYRKKGDCPMPLKWMAIESIKNNIFSIQSDVWSFGVVLWEFFSLACNPYPGIEADEKLYQRLVNGYRMEKPKYATQYLYNVMQSCWMDNPSERPSFSELSELLGNVINKTTKNHYIDLSSPYTLINQDMFKESPDYLSTLNLPNYDNIMQSTGEKVYSRIKVAEKIEASNLNSENIELKNVINS